MRETRAQRPLTDTLGAPRKPGGGAAGGARRRRPSVGDVVAGISVALVLIPQSLAYAALAGMPPERGLYAAGIPLLVAAPFASSPYLQTGPVAITSLLTLGALTTLAAPGSDEYVALGLLLALVVGVARVLVGLLRAGVIAYLMSQPLLTGFIPAAAVLIIASQVPAALGAEAPTGGVIEQAGRALSSPGGWEPTSIALSLVVVVTVFGGRRIHALFPGVLVAVAAAIAFSTLTAYRGETVGEISVGAPPLSLDLPWGELPSLLLAGVVIALVGFAEPASIARAFAVEDRVAWDSNREFVSQGMANVAAAFSGGFPVGGSFSRSSLNRLAGAGSAVSGAITGLAVLAFLPFAFVLAPLPAAVLAAIVIAAVVPLVRLGPLLRLWRFSRPAFLTATATFVLTLALAPHVERAVLAGVGLAIAVHLWRELRIDASVWYEGDDLHVRPAGVLWFGPAQGLGEGLVAQLAEHPEARRLVLHLDGLGRIDVTGALVLRTVVEEAERSGLETELVGVQEKDRRLMPLLESDRAPLEG